MSTNEIHAQGGEIIIYQTPDGQTDINVQMKDETIWLDRHQMAILFDRDVKTIGKHIANALREELDGGGVAKFATPVPKGANPGQTQLVERSYYNLDVIISVGYRVKSKRGIDFRRWANRVLKDYLIKGYVINRNIISQRYEELKQLVQVMGRTADIQESLTTTEAHDMINVVSDYAYALDTLDRYDYEQLRIEATTQEEKFHATYEAAMDTIHTLRDKFEGSTLFGNEKDDSFKSSIGQIYQTFGGEELYPSVEEKAAMLLYLVTKNHSFSDGNKRIAATLFLWFMQQNGILYKADGSKRITDGTLVALTLMIAESRTEEKDVMVKVVVNLINKNNE
jgi:phosphoribosylaminoimidazolesuccinocarboxamide synthase